MTEQNSAKYFSDIPEELASLFKEAENVWEIVPKIKDVVTKLVQEKSGSGDAVNEGVRVGEVYLDHNVYVGKGTVLEHGAMIKGPVYIGKNCEIRNGAYLRGPVFIADNCIVGHCVEVKNSIFLPHAHAGHFNYVGDSILGADVNLGGGSILANLRFDKKEIMIGDQETDLKKLGGILGDNCKLGCNTVLNPGVILEKDVWYAGKPLPSGFYNKEQIKKLMK